MGISDSGAVTTCTYLSEAPECRGNQKPLIQEKEKKYNGQ
jgi:hypothetical protein